MNILIFINELKLSVTKYIALNYDVYNYIVCYFLIKYIYLDYEFVLIVNHL